MSLFITFEGPDGSGKSTQVSLLAAALAQRGFSPVVTREPGGTPLGNAIRNLVHDRAHSAMSVRAEALLYNAARAQLVDEIIRPALTDGGVVVCDRFADSTLAYQGYGYGRDLVTLRRIIEFATGGLQPDLTFLLNLDPAQGLLRKQTAADGDWNRMEDKELAFHRAVHTGYLMLAAQEPQRWLVVDATQSIDAIQAIIWGKVTTHLPKTS